MPELLQSWVTQQAERRPEAQAVVLETEALTYGELELLSNRIAHTLLEAGCEAGDRVCLLMPKSPLTIAALVGVYKAGCIGVPMDQTNPPSRLASIVRSCEPRHVLAAGPAAARALPELHEQCAGTVPFGCGWLDTDISSPLDASFAHEDVLAAPESGRRIGRQEPDAAHILFTSGSTGEPKGVVIPHRTVRAFVDWGVGYFGITERDRVSAHAPLHFDLSTFDIFGAFAAGAALHLVPEDCRMLPHRLADWIRESELTQWFSAPSALGYMAKFDVLRAGDLPRLERVIWCGEVLPTPVLRYWMQRVPHASFTNLYGPTEATIASSYYTVPECPDDPTAEIPIGQPCGGEELVLMNEHMQPAGVGEVADLYIKGAGLATGYYKNPDETRRAFIVGPDGSRMYRTGDRARRGSDGLFYFVGRNDHQIKCRGHRIEIGEIERALSGIDMLRESAVIPLPSDGFEGVAIGCAYVPGNGQTIRPADIRTALRRSIPDYMIPTRWKFFPELPRNSSGKVDRKQIRERWLNDETDTA